MQAQKYAALRKPYLINDMQLQDLLLDRRAVYATLEVRLACCMHSKQTCNGLEHICDPCTARCAKLPSAARMLCAPAPEQPVLYAACRTAASLCPPISRSTGTGSSRVLTQKALWRQRTTSSWTVSRALYAAGTAQPAQQAACVAVSCSASC